MSDDAIRPNTFTTFAPAEQVKETPQRKQVDYSPAAIAGYCGRGERSGKAWKCNCPICRHHSLSVSYHPTYPIKCWFCHDFGINDGCTEQRQWLIDKGLLPEEFSIKKLSLLEYTEYCKVQRARAVGLWDQSVPIGHDDVAANYLKARGLVSFVGHAALRRSSIFAGMLVSRVWHVNHGLSAVQQTWIDQDGTGRDKSRPRITIGVLSGGAVWINAPRPDEEFVVGEGLETVLSAMLLLKLRCGAAVLGTNFKKLVLPYTAKCIRIGADNDDAGRGASKCAAELWRKQGLKVQISMPDKEGEDFNNVLLREGTKQ